MSDLPKILDEDLITPKHPSCLIWADDHNTIRNWRWTKKILNSLTKYCEENDLVVNLDNKMYDLVVDLDKTKCMIFNKSGKLIRRNFYFNGIKLETVRSFKYLGLLSTPSGEIRRALNDLRDKAMKAFFKLKNGCNNPHTYNNNTTSTGHPDKTDTFIP